MVGVLVRRWVVWLDLGKKKIKICFQEKAGLMGKKRKNQTVLTDVVLTGVVRAGMGTD
jgi:hypothetical protein